MTEDKHVKANSTVTLDVVTGNLVVEENAVIKGTGAPPTVKVAGTVYCEDFATFDCNLQAENFEAEADVTIRGDLQVKGEINSEEGTLTVEGNVCAKRIDVNQALHVEKDLATVSVNVGGSLRINGNAKAEDIDVGGSCKIKGEVTAESIDIGGSFAAESKATITRLDVGGKARVNGGKIQRIDVGGTFESDASLEFEEVDVGGAIHLVGNSKGKRVEVGGALRVNGNFAFEIMDVGGKVEIAGSAEGLEVEVGGKIEVKDQLKLTGNLDVGGKVDVGELSAANVDVGGTLRARKVMAEQSVKVGGSIITEQGVNAYYVEIGKRGEVKGPIKATEVVVGRDATVETVYGRKILLRSGAQAQNVYGEDITIEPHSRVTGEIKYTRELKIAEASLSKPPQKVDTLPW